MYTALEDMSWAPPALGEAARDVGSVTSFGRAEESQVKGGYQILGEAKIGSL